MRPILLATMVALGALSGAACVPLRQHQGYIIDTDLVNSVRPGIDNRDSVLATLGKPTIDGQFTDRSWYYLARDTRNLAFRNPHATAELTLEIQFDDSGNVSTIRRGGLAQVAQITPGGRTTPTLGRKRSFFQDLFGNIGTVGAPGGGGAGGAGPGGGNGQP